MQLIKFVIKFLFILTVNAKTIYFKIKKKKLIRLIISGEPKESICSSIDSTCNGLIVDNLQEKNKTYPFCTACKFILTFIISQLDEDYTQKKIEKVLVKVCSKIPTFKEACMNLLRNFTSLLIQYLEQKLPPNTICKKLRLCNPIFESLELIISEERLANDKTDCEICTFVVDETQKKVHEVPVFEVKNLALNTCNSLTQTDKTKCKLFVKSLDTMTLNYIHNNYGSDFICGNNLLNVC